ncbi:MAG: lipase class 2 [Frankiales bacterium]|nr:lipase class 2 [Frankiales bacterium]
MSPARRLLFRLLAAVLGVALAVGAVLAFERRGAGPARLTVGAVAQDRPGTVLLVPGYGGSTASLEVLAARLRQAGRTTRLVPLPGDGTGDLRAAARTLDDAVQAALRAGTPSVDLVGYSAGGIVVRLWLRDGGAASTRRVVTLGSPHHGTDLAAAGSTLTSRQCPVACRQLVPGSSLLTGLNAGDETPDGPAYLSLWTTSDETVTPPGTAALAGATEVVLQDLCPGARTSHSDLPRDPRVQAVVLAALGAAPLTPPTACVSS